MIERDPVVSHYKNLRIVSAAPPSSGGIVLAQALTMLEGFVKSLDIQVRALTTEQIRRHAAHKLIQNEF